MTTPSPEQEQQPRDTAYWAEEASIHKVERVPTGAPNLNVEGHQVLSPLQGFGQLWQKVYQARVNNATVTPGEMVRVWKENFPQFWPKGNRFYAPPTGITPGAVAILSFGMPRVPGSLGILHLRYGLDDDRHRTLKEAGEELGVTCERMRQIELKALQKLHEPSCVWKLKDYLW